MWFDANQDGFADVDEFGQPIDRGIGSVVIRLEAIIDGAQVTLETVTDAEGYYSFTGLMAGEYILSEDQPRLDPDDPESGFYADGRDTLGSIEGADESTWGVFEEPDRFAAIRLGTNQHAVGYIFTEQISDNH